MSALLVQSLWALEVVEQPLTIRAATAITRRLMDKLQLAAAVVALLQVAVQELVAVQAAGVAPC